MEKQVPVERLTVGMFVSELDRPWLDTPFLLQGFLIEDETTLAQLRQICGSVTVDIRRSSVTDWDGLDADEEVTDSASHSESVVYVSVVKTQVQRRRQSWLSKLIHSFNQPEGQLPREAANQTRSPVPHARAYTREPEPIVRSSRGPVVERLEAHKSASQSALLESSPAARPFDVLGWLRANLGSTPERTAHKERSAPVPESPTDGPRGTGTPRIRIYRETTPIAEELGPANERFAQASQVFEGVIEDIRVGKGLEIEAVQNVVEGLVDSIIRNPNALQLVSRLREANESAYIHALQIAVLMVTFGRELGFSRTELASLGQIGMLMDIGKLRVDPAILSKRGILTPEEFQEIRRHVAFGLEMMSASGTSPDVVSGVADHHERLDGSGYPRGKREEDTCIFGRMGGIVDSFAALTSIRPYAEPVSPYEAMRQLQGWSGTYFNAGLVEQFIQAIGIFPVGTLVELSTGEIGVVLEQSKVRRLKPKVLIITAADQSSLKIPVTVDLLFGRGAESASAPYIRRGLPAEACGVDPKEYYLSRS
jgi:HD-GYP domain-containing protein (c-di-GMP phosphodiesterase class II)